MSEINQSNNSSTTNEIEDKIMLYARAVSGLYERMLNYAGVETSVEPSNFNEMQRLVNKVYGTDSIGFNLDQRLRDGSKRENILKDLEEEFKQNSLEYKELFSQGLTNYFENELEADFIGNTFPDPEDRDAFEKLLKNIGSRVFAQILAKAIDGDPYFQLLLGKSYFLGWGTAVNPEEGIKWIREAAKSKDSEALYYAGLAEETITNQQTGVRLNPDSVNYYIESFENGNPEAAFALYRYYKNYNQDYSSIKESKKWLRRGLEENSKYCSYVNQKQPKTSWAPNNILNIFDWIRAAAIFQEPEAYVLLAKLYKNGHAGLEQDHDKEMECLRIAGQLSQY